MSSLVAVTLHSPAPHRSGVARSAPRRAYVEAFGLSHPGLVRPGNEDCYLVAPELGLHAVTDGMGGAAAGEVASRMTIDAVRCAFEDADVTWPRSMVEPPPPAPGLPLLVAAVERANVRVHAAACADRAKAGMGTTITAMLVLEDGVAVAHVGDSRLYRLRRRHLERLTRDHTHVDRCIRLGLMTREDAERSPFRHIVTRAIGTEPTVRVDRRLFALEPGDTFLLATDGLHGVVGDDDIAATLLAEHDLLTIAPDLGPECQFSGAWGHAVSASWGQGSGPDDRSRCFSGSSTTQRLSTEPPHTPRISGSVQRSLCVRISASSVSEAVTSTHRTPFHSSPWRAKRPPTSTN